MGHARFGILVVMMVGAATPASVSAQPRAEQARPDAALILVQREIDYLPATERTISLDLEKVEPAAVLRKIAERSGLTIEVHGSLPDRPVLSATFRDTRTKDVLEWFAKEVPVSYRAVPPSELWVIVDTRGERGDPPDGG